MSCELSEKLAAHLIQTGGQSWSAGGDKVGAQAPLGLHEGIDAEGRYLDPAAGGCGRWPEHLRLLNQTTGEVVRGRCRATNLCRYCQALYVLETVEMLTLDALEHAPTLWAVLTAREHLTRAQLRRHLDHLRRRVLRPEWPDVEWFVQVEFQRRGALHANLLIKGVPEWDLPRLEKLTSDAWCERVDAEPPWAVMVKRVDQAEGLVRYLQKTLSHGLKQEQAPPIGWRGHRTSQTRGYLVRPASVMREEARAALKLKRELWRAMRAGHEGPDAERVAGQALADRQADDWRLYSASHLLAGFAPRPERTAL